MSTVLRQLLMGQAWSLIFFAGYVYKRDPDLSFGLEIRNSRYPGARASLPLRDKFDYLEIIPSVSYKTFSAYFAYSVTDRSGVNQNLAQLSQFAQTKWQFKRLLVC